MGEKLLFGAQPLADLEDELAGLQEGLGGAVIMVDVDRHGARGADLACWGDDGAAPAGPPTKHDLSWSCF